MSQRSSGHSFGARHKARRLTYRKAFEPEVLLERDCGSDPGEPLQTKEKWNGVSTRHVSPRRVCMRRHESLENKGWCCLPSADDDDARSFFRFRSERVIVGGRGRSWFRS